MSHAVELVEKKRLDELLHGSLTMVIGREMAGGSQRRRRQPSRGAADGSPKLMRMDEKREDR